MSALIRNNTVKPLLTVGDLEPPLRLSEEVDGAAILTLAGQEPDPVALEAVSLYRRKEVTRLIGGTADNSGKLAEWIEALDERLPAEIQESDLLSRLVSDLARARAESAAANSTSRFPDIFGLRRRREQKERVEALREKAAVHEMIDVTDLREGDSVTFHSKLHENQGKAESTLKGEVIGVMDTDIGPAVLIRVASEKRKGDCKFSSAQRDKGAVARLTGTVFWSNSYRKYPSKIMQGETLEFVDAEGRPYVNSVTLPYAKSSSITHALGMSLKQLTINGIDIFPSPK